MSKNAFIAGGLGLAAAAGLLMAAASQDERPRFYARRVSDHVNVVDPQNALGEPDGRFAEVRPGGELTVVMSETIYYSDASDDGAVVVKGSGSYGIAGLFRMNEEGQSAWQPLAPGRTPGGFKFGTSMFNVVQSTDTIKIANDDSRSLFVDAFVGYRKDDKSGR
jgi:hypothetical protein